jgi:hypothetical protein
MAFSSPLGFSGTEIKWVEQPQAGNPFETIQMVSKGTEGRNRLSYRSGELKQLK